MTDDGHLQRATAQRFGATPLPVDPRLKVGIAANVRIGLQPVNALRHRPEGDTSGWYIWAGEVFSDDPDFFMPLHITHLSGWCPEIVPYLALPPGWRVLIAPGHEDVWFDAGLV